MLNNIAGCVHISVPQYHFLNDDCMEEVLTKLKNVSCSILVAMVLAVGPFAPSLAYGQQVYADGWIGLSTTTTTTAVTVGGIVLTVVLVMGASKADVETYIRNNAVALQEDITLGGGATTRDLAAAFQVPDEHLPLFAAMLKEQRQELLPLTNVTLLNEERAGQFIDVILAGMIERPELAAQLEIKAS